MKYSRLPRRPLAYILLLITAIIWGLSAPIVKRGYQDGLTPNDFLLGRYLVAAFTSLPIFFWFRNHKDAKIIFKPKNLLKVLALETLGTVVSLAILYAGLAKTGAIESTIISATYPFFMTLGGMFFLRETIQKNEWSGLILAMIGTLFLVVDPRINGHVGFSHTTGNVMVMTQNIVVAIYYLMVKKAYKPFNKWIITHLSFWVGIIGFTLLIISSGLNPYTEITHLFTLHSFWPIFAIVYMGLGGSVIAATFLLIGQDWIEASEASLFSYLYPLFGVPASVWLLGEQATPFEIISIVIITIGVILAERRVKKRRG